MPKIRCKRGFQAGVDAMGGIELPGIGRMVSVHSSALFHATARAPMQVLGLFFKTWVLPLYVTALLRHTLAEPHEDGGNLGPGGITCGIQVPVHAFHDALGHAQVMASWAQDWIWPASG